MGKKKSGVLGTIGAVAGGPMGGGLGMWLGGASDAADSAGRAAMAQAAEAGNQRAIIMMQAQRNQEQAMKLAEASPQELAALDRSMGAAQNSLAREERLLAAIDPALMEASTQALKLLRGDVAEVNKPAQDMRASQRNQLVNSLRAQYGPGAESTSIGQRALQQFDMESSSMFQQNQQQSLGQMFGIASQDFGGRMSRGIGDLMGVGQGYGHLQERKLNTQMQTGNSMLAALSGSAQPIIEGAGARHVASGLQAQAMSNFGQGVFNTGMQFAGAAAGAGMGGGGGKAKPTTSPEMAYNGRQMGGQSNLNTGVIS